MPTFRIEDENGQWMTDMRLGPQTWRPGDPIPRGRDTLEVVAVRERDDTVTLVVNLPTRALGCAEGREGGRSRPSAAAIGAAYRVSQPGCRSTGILSYASEGRKRRARCEPPACHPSAAALCDSGSSAALQHAQPEARDPPHSPVVRSAAAASAETATSRVPAGPPSNPGRTAGPR